MNTSRAAIAGRRGALREQSPNLLSIVSGTALTGTEYSLPITPAGALKGAAQGKKSTAWRVSDSITSRGAKENPGAKAGVLRF
ncbi:MAG: hypothetical protein ACXIVG_08145 [Pararhodobacter sp.]